MSHSADDRYARQVRFDPIGEVGQRKISASTVAVLGCGALGTVAAEILVRAGAGTLKLIDRDVVEWTNLQRQSLFDERDASEGRSKAAAATEQLRRINSTITVEPIVADVTADNIRGILDGVDLVVDAADNFSVRFLLNDWSLATATPWVHGGCVGASGQVRLFDGTGSPCFRCVVPQPPPASAVATCDTAGVIGSATHLIASLQATEAIKWISGNRQQARTKMLSLDLWNNRIRELEIPLSLGQSCVACGKGNLEFLRATHGSSDAAIVLCGRHAVQINLGHGSVDLPTMAQRWTRVGRVQTTPFFVRLQLEKDAHSLTLFKDGRVVVSGTACVSEARTLYDRYVGG